MREYQTVSSSFGRNIKVTIFGGSHEPEIGVTIEHLPAGFAAADVDMEAMASFLARRAPGSTPYGTPRKESDTPVLTSDSPLTYVIRNEHQRSGDYEELRARPRPGHADLTARIKYGDTVNMAGGGPFSGRMTAPLCIAGAIAKQILSRQGIEVAAVLTAAGDVATTLPWQEGDAHALASLLPQAEDSAWRAQDPMYQRILAAKQDGDSVGGVVHGVASGVPAGVGGPMYDGLESYLSPIVFGIPGVKGLSFGEGFAAARMKGSEHNDPFTLAGDIPSDSAPSASSPAALDPPGKEAGTQAVIDLSRIRTVTNHAGGILGGISDGMDISMDVAFKPTASIAREQRTVDLTTGATVPLSVKGRHDPCIAVRAVPVVEAAMALGLLDAMCADKEAWDE